MSDNFIDPENIDEIMEKIKTIPDLNGINDLIKKIYPDWVITFLDKYSNDYPHLEKNWDQVTKDNNITKSKIMIIDNIFKDDKHTLINIFTDIYTRSGFIVRTKFEIFPCQVCNAAIPNINFYNKMKELKLEVPDIWSDKCTNC